ncbi:hypothetical protein EYF80_009681 [Liparis tanakae]|uniref:Uncharacterized protein n=1 Tax=Liparis tanakae TaxID=230148 RepID=A0A4Z2IRZ0_9TELE|nr:hypothetical protein EYF80_009681 [Liparis tanakae]
MHHDHAAARAEAHLNMAVIISQVRERTPIQMEGMVTVFRNWWNWWYYPITVSSPIEQCPLVNMFLPPLLPILPSALRRQKLTCWSSRSDRQSAKVKSSESESAQRAEEEQGHGDLNDEGRHHTQLLPPHRQLVSVPGQLGGDALSLVVIRQSCSTHRGNTR